jgi:hypothetical protein
VRVPVLLPAWHASTSPTYCRWLVQTNRCFCGTSSWSSTLRRDARQKRSSSTSPSTVAQILLCVDSQPWAARVSWRARCRSDLWRRASLCIAGVVSYAPLLLLFCSRRVRFRRCRSSRRFAAPPCVFYRAASAGLPRLRSEAVTGLPNITGELVVDVEIVDLDDDRDVDVVLVTATNVYILENIATATLPSYRSVHTASVSADANAVVMDMDRGGWQAA